MKSGDIFLYLVAIDLSSGYGGSRKKKSQRRRQKMKRLRLGGMSDCSRERWMSLSQMKSLFVDEILMCKLFSMISTYDKKCEMNDKW
jgi:hypothetical protein